MFLAFEVFWSRGPDVIRCSVLWQWMYFPNYVLIERCELSAMNREHQMLDKAI